MNTQNISELVIKALLSNTVDTPEYLTLTNVTPEQKIELDMLLRSWLESIGIENLF